MNASRILVAHPFPDVYGADRVLLDAVEAMIRNGERRPLMLSNKAIDAYKRFKIERHKVLVA